MSDQSEQVRRVQKDDGRPTEELIAAYEAGPARLRATLAGMDPAQLRARPIEGRMSSLEVLSHLADCEQFLADRMKRTAGTHKPLLVGIDNTPYLALLHYHDRDPELQLELIDVTRRQMAEDLRRLEPDAWTREAIHTETGLVTLRQLLLHTIRHLEMHLTTIEEKRRALGLEPRDV
jgi:uncharacterized damage-inducible protein DinB